MSDDPIADLISACASGDRAAFRTLYRDSSAKLMGVLLRILKERAEAEDALQEVYTRVWLRAGRYDAAKGRGMTWLIAIARNLAIDRLRARPEATSDDGLDLVQDSAPRAETGRTDARRIPAGAQGTFEQYYRPFASGGCGTAVLRPQARVPAVAGRRPRTTARFLSQPILCGFDRRVRRPMRAQVAYRPAVAVRGNPPGSE